MPRTEPRPTTVVGAAHPPRTAHPARTLVAAIVTAIALPAALHLFGADPLIPLLLVVGTASLLRSGRHLLDRLLLSGAVLAGGLLAAGLVFSVWPWGPDPLMIGWVGTLTLVAVAAATGRRPRLPLRISWSDGVVVGSGLVAFLLARRPIAGLTPAEALGPMMTSLDRMAHFALFDTIRRIEGYTFFDQAQARISVQTPTEIVYPQGSHFLAALAESFLGHPASSGDGLVDLHRWFLFVLAGYGLLVTCLVWAARWIAGPTTTEAGRVLISGAVAAFRAARTAGRADSVRGRLAAPRADPDRDRGGGSGPAAHPAAGAGAGAERPADRWLLPLQTVGGGHRRGYRPVPAGAPVPDAGPAPGTARRGCPGGGDRGAAVRPDRAVLGRRRCAGADHRRAHPVVAAAGGAGRRLAWLPFVLTRRDPGRPPLRRPVAALIATVALTVLGFALYQIGDLPNSYYLPKMYAAGYVALLPCLGTFGLLLQRRRHPEPAPPRQRLARPAAVVMVVIGSVLGATALVQQRVPGTTSWPQDVSFVPLSRWSAGDDHTDLAPVLRHLEDRSDAGSRWWWSAIGRCRTGRSASTWPPGTASWA